MPWLLDRRDVGRHRRNERGICWPAYGREWETGWLQLNFPAIGHDNFLQVISLSPFHFRSLARFRGSRCTGEERKKARVLCIMTALITFPSCSSSSSLLAASRKAMINLEHAIASERGGQQTDRYGRGAVQSALMPNREGHDSKGREISHLHLYESSSWAK